MVTSGQIRPARTCLVRLPASSVEVSPSAALSTFPDHALDLGLDAHKAGTR